MLVNDSSAAERKKAQRATMHLTEKRDKSIKGRMVCDKAPTREWTGPEESASSTAAQESMMLLAVVDAHECQDIVMSDVPNASMQTALECHGGCD